jgi:phenylpyruvate tautomerase PptA (4-oxalocrotonate tautomerase family)
MPFVTVSLFPPHARHNIEECKSTIQVEIARILKIEKKHITVSFPQDLKSTVGEELIIKIECIANKSERTAEVIQELADNVLQAMSHFTNSCIPQNVMIEVFAEVFGDPTKNACASRQKRYATDL